MSSAIAGHGALIAIEKDGASAGTFTTIAELLSDLDFGVNRPMTEVSPHNDTIDSHVSGIMRRDPVSFEVNFLFGNDSHDHLTGLQKRWIDGDTFGVRWRGPGGGASSNEIIGSGEVESFRRIAPAREGQYRAEVTLRLSGPMIIDGVTVGTVA